MRYARLAAVALLVVIVAPCAPSDADVAWPPKPGTTWQIQFTGKLDRGVNADVFDIDMFDTPANVVAALHRRGRRVVCYINGGAWENWRPDADRFPKATLGRPLAGWPGERWLDIVNVKALAPIMRARLQQCARKGFDGVEFDNVDGFTHETGFRFKASDQLRFNRFLAKEAHELGLEVGLKNDLGQIRQLEPSFDFAINESCLEYDECSELQPFIDANKAVFHIEYTGSMALICARMATTRLSTIKKHRELDAYREMCPGVGRA